MKSILTVVLTAVALGGCAMGGTYSASEPFISEASEHRLDADGTFHTDGIMLKVIPLNYKPGLDTAGPIFPFIPFMCCRGLDRSNQSFHVVLDFHPKNEEFTFTPGDVALGIDGKNLTPTASGGPFPCGADEGRRTWCKYQEQDLQTSDLLKPVPIRRGSYILAYPVMTPDPREPFVIRIAGLRRNGQPQIVPQIDFKGVYRGFWFLFAGL